MIKKMIVHLICVATIGYVCGFAIASDNSGHKEMFNCGDEDYQKFFNYTQNRWVQDNYDSQGGQAMPKPLHFEQCQKRFNNDFEKHINKSRNKDEKK